MIGSDAVIGWVSAGGSGASVNPYRLVQKDTGNPSQSAVANPMLVISNTMIDETNGITTMYFTRTTASGQNPITDLTSVTVIGSTHDTFDGLQYHTCRVGQSYNLNLISGGASEGAGDQLYENLKNAHGALMLWGWGIFLTLGVIIARYGKSLGGDLWFELHRGLQTLGLILATAGFIIAWIMVNGDHFMTAFHAQLGLTIMIIAYFQFLMGVFRPHKEPGEKPTRPRKVFEVAHPWTGRLLILLAVINVFAGISTWWHYWVIIVYAVLVFFFGVICIIGEVSLRKTGKMETS
jgi:hypothetical protein